MLQAQAQKIGESFRIRDAAQTARVVAEKMAEPGVEIGSTVEVGAEEVFASTGVTTADQRRVAGSPYMAFVERAAGYRVTFGGDVWVIDLMMTVS